MGRVGLLLQIIECYAPPASTQAWRERFKRSRAIESLGSEAAKWSGSALGEGQRIYHYRTRTTRALLWAPTGLTLTLLIIPLLPREVLPPNRDDGSEAILIIMCAACIIGSLYGWWRFYKAAIHTDETGIEQHTPFGVKRLAWPEIEKYSLHSQGGWIAGKGKRLTFSSYIADVEELKEEITRRAVNAPPNQSTFAANTMEQKSHSTVRRDP